MGKYEDKFAQIDFTEDIGPELKESVVVKELVPKLGFIDTVIDTLNKDDLSIKKNYFIDHQAEVKGLIDDLKKYLTSDLDGYISSLPSDEETPCFTALYEMISDMLHEIETGIDNFSKQLTSSVSKDVTEKDDIVIDEDTVSEAIKTNETTQQIMQNVSDAESNPEKYMSERKTALQNAFAENKANKNVQKQWNNPYLEHNFGHKKAVTQSKTSSSVANATYMVFDEVTGAAKFITGNPSNTELENYLSSSGFRSPVLFKLSLIPTTTKTITKIVTPSKNTVPKNMFSKFRT